MGRQIRKSKGKTMKPNFFVFCEGESEVAYISHLRSQYRAPIQIIPRKSDSNISVRYIENCKREYVVTKNDKTLLWLLLIIISGSNLPHFLMYILKRKNMLTNWRDLTKIGSTRMRHHEQHSTPTYLQVNIVFWSRHWMKVEWKMKIMKNSA